MDKLGKLEQLDKMLGDIQQDCKENPSPDLSSVAVKLGINRSTVQRRWKELTGSKIRFDRGADTVTTGRKNKPSKFDRYQDEIYSLLHAPGKVSIQKVHNQMREKYGDDEFGNYSSLFFYIKTRNLLEPDAQREERLKIQQTEY